MISFTRKTDYLYRIYLDGDTSEIVQLASYINENYHEPNQYLEDTYLNAEKIQELDNLIFVDEQGDPYFPSGLREMMEAICVNLGFEVVINLTPDPDPEPVEVDPDLLEGITLRPYQQKAVEKALSIKRGLVMSPTGSGKTAMIAALARYLIDHKEDLRMIVGVPSVYLLHQIYQEFIDLGIEEENLGKMGDGHSLDDTKAVNISTVATLYSEVANTQDEYYQSIDCLVFDEAHHTSAFTWYTITDSLNTEYMLGFSASPFHGDKEHLLQDLLVRGSVGPIIYKVEQKDLVDSGYISKPYIFLLESETQSNIKFLIDWQPLYKTGIVSNQFRNTLIVDLANYLISIDRRPLITVQRIAHGKNLASSVSKEGNITAFIQGGSKVSLYRDGRLQDVYKDDTGETNRRFEAGSIDCLIGTSTLDEGVNMPSISAVILAGGQKAQIKTLQRVGRGLRKKEGDNTTYIFDFKDDFNVVLAKHSRERQKVFKSLQIPMFEVRSLEDLPSLIEHLRDVK